MACFVFCKVHNGTFLLINQESVWNIQAPMLFKSLWRKRLIPPKILSSFHVLIIGEHRIYIWWHFEYLTQVCTSYLNSYYHSYHNSQYQNDYIAKHVNIFLYFAISRIILKNSGKINVFCMTYL